MSYHSLISNRSFSVQFRAVPLKSWGQRERNTQTSRWGQDEPAEDGKRHLRLSKNVSLFKTKPPSFLRPKVVPEGQNECEGASKGIQVVSTGRARAESTHFWKVSLGWEVSRKIFQLQWSAVICRLKQQFHGVGVWNLMNHQINSPFTSLVEDEDGCGLAGDPSARGAAAGAPPSSKAAQLLSPTGTLAWARKGFSC